MSYHDKTPIDVSLVQRLIADQFPEWADLAIKPVQFSGWDNKTFSGLDCDSLAFNSPNRGLVVSPSTAYNLGASIASLLAIAQILTNKLTQNDFFYYLTSLSLRSNCCTFKIVGSTIITCSHPISFSLRSIL